LDLEKSDDEGEDEEASSEGFDPGSEAEDDDESSEDMSDEVRHTAVALGGLHCDSPSRHGGGGAGAARHSWDTPTADEVLLYSIAAGCSTTSS
jgi:hypothetical protein